MENENKTIYFVGLNGRLEKRSNNKRSKPFVEATKEIKKRVDSDKWDLSEDFLLSTTQLELIKEIIKNDYKALTLNNESKLIIQQLERKISGYKQQDIDKNIFNSQKIVNLKNIIDSLISCEMKCYYCKSDVLLLYEIVREHKQWTVDRIDNDLGHNYDNYLIACLECNLKRRRRSKDAYFFTKNLSIVKQNNEK